MVDADIAVMGLMQTMLHAKKLEPKQLHVVMIMLMVTRVGMMGLMQPVPVSNSKWSMPVVANARHRTYTVRVDINQDEDRRLLQYININSIVLMAAAAASAG